MILLFLSLLAGILTVLAPCTIALLPVIVGGSVGGGQSMRRAVVVTGSLGVSVILFTFLLKVSAIFINVPQEFWQILSGAIIFLIGVTMIFPSLYENLPWINKLNRDSNKFLAAGYNKKNFTGDIIVGAALGPVFSSCSPTYFLILATVLPHNLGAGFIYLLAYAFGLSAALLVVCFAGQKLMEKLGIASDPKGWIKRSIGVIFIIIGLAILFGYDQKIESSIANAGYFDVTKIEQKFLAKDLSTKPTSAAPAQPIGGQNQKSVSQTQIQDAQTRIAVKSSQYQKEPEITNPSGFINTGGQPITLSSFIGKKVVLVDF
jgi:cytochrome c biogenesis protein CcdA